MVRRWRLIGHFLILYYPVTCGRHPVPRSGEKVANQSSIPARPVSIRRASVGIRWAQTGRWPVCNAAGFNRRRWYRVLFCLPAGSARRRWSRLVSNLPLVCTQRVCNTVGHNVGLLLRGDHKQRRWYRKAD